MGLQSAESRNSQFGYLNKNQALFILILSVANSLLYTVSLYGVAELLIFAAVLITAIGNPFVCMGVYTTSSLYIGTLFPASMQVFLSLIVGISFFMHNVGMVRHLQCGRLLLSAFFLVMVSYTLGVDSSFNTATLMLVCIFNVVVLINASNFATGQNVAIVIWAHICRAISVSIYFVFQALRGIAVVSYGRLSFDGDIKTVAAVVAIPVILILCSSMEGKALFSNFQSKILSYVFAFIFSGVLLLTAARGMILAVVLGLIIHWIISDNKAKLIWRFLPIIVFASVFIYISMDSDTFRIMRLFESDEFGTMNGRSDIWLYYIKKVIESGPLHVLIGIGPGDISRIADTGYYAHSTFLDFFFSYGILGFAGVVACEFSVLRKLCRSRNATLISLMIASIIMYATHGSAANTPLFMLQAILLLRIRGDGSCKYRGNFGGVGSE